MEEIVVRKIIQQHLRRYYSDDHRPKRVLAEARALASQAKYDAALERYLWFHQHALEYNEALAGVRLSFALGEWVELGDKYPPARHALLRVRDDAARAIEDGEGSFNLFHDVAAINERLHEEAETVRLFRLMHHGQTKLAGECYGVAERFLVDSGDFATCTNYIPDLDMRLEEIRQLYQITLEIAEENPVLGSPNARLREFAISKLIQEASRLIAILEGVGRLKDADRVREFMRLQGRQ
jgi:hypothetical protein